MKHITLYFPGDGTKGSNSASYKNCTVLDARDNGIKFNTAEDGDVIFNGPYRIKDKEREGKKAPAAEAEPAVARPRRNW